MKYITGIRLINYTRFRGTHELQLEPGVYAVTAQDEQNPDRSNWLGKSAFVHSIVYALFGVVHGNNADSVVTEGETEGGVELEFDDGSFISRRRIRGKRTQLEFYIDDEPLVGDGAEAEICRRLGQGYEDFKQTCFFEQGSMSNVIDEKPAERTARISGWMSIDQVQEAHALVGQWIATQATKHEELNRELVLLEKMPNHNGHSCSLVEWPSDIRNCIKRYQDEYDRGLQEAARLKHEWVIWRNATTQNAMVVERECYKKELALLVIPEDKPTPADELARAKENLWKGSETLTQLHSLVRGEFDGKCPVSGGECPITSEMNKGCTETYKRYEEQRVVTGRMKDDVYRIEQLVRAADEHNRKASATRLRAEYWKERIDTLQDVEAIAAPSEEPIRCAANDFELRTAKKLAQTAGDAVRKHESLQGQIEKTEARLKVLRIAALVLGREGVQRRLIEVAMVDIEARANAALGRVGVPLELSVEWGKELGRPAEDCSTCGQPYLRSARVKTCTACGAVRGKARDGKLYLRLSAVSGAAKDLGGIAFRLAGARWLAEARDSGWGVVVLDEPMGQLDRHNSRAMARSFQQLLGDGFTQAFVIAHDRGTLDALPRRIQITGRGKYSEVCVG